MWGYFLVVVLAMSSVWGRNRNPLIDEEQTRTRNKAAECVFGKQIRELRSQWIPDLGVPIGVLYCMRCECVPFQRKRRIVAKVQCRNIKSECPEPTCDEPVLLPGRCCKSCPEDTHSPDMIQDIVSQNVIEDEEKSIKHFAALLTGRSSLDLKNDTLMEDLNKNNVVATGRLIFHRKNLHYSFYISEKAARPRALHFMDSEGNILEEFILSHAGGLVNSLYQNATRKVCGIWRRLPKDYRRLLKNEKMYVVLIWGTKDTEFTLSGKLTRYVALASEQYSSLLEPAPGTDSMMLAGAGGTAIISTSSNLSPSLHLAIIFNGLFTSLDSVDVPINVKLVLDEKKQVILDENVRVYKPAIDLNLLELSSPVSQADLRSLSRGRVFLTVSSVSKPEALSLSGSVITKVTCEIFQTTLSSKNDNQDGFPGLTWMYLNNQGSLIYNIQIDNLDSEQYLMITLSDTSGKKRTEAWPLSFNNGWSNGTEDKVVHKILEPLYNGKLDVEVAVANDTLHGHLNSKLVADARDAPAPILLKRENSTLPSNVVGLAWISVDSDCHIQYDVSVSGLGHDRKLELYMEMYPIIAPGAPFIYKHLEEFEGNQVEGSPIEALTKEELDRLDGGVNFIRIKDASTKVVLLSATLTKVKLPYSCRLPYNDNNVPTFFDRAPDLMPTEDCFFEDKFYKKDTSWVSPRDACRMCFCQDGASKCDFMTCPKLDCPNGNLTRVVGECCPICIEHESRSSAQKCLFNGMSYSPGSKFYPFLIPTGFDVCTECYCDPKKSEITCQRLDETDKRCCRNCQKQKTTEFEDDPVQWSVMLNKQHKERVVATTPAVTILAEGGCKNLNNAKEPYPNGSSYHPFIASLGEYKCITCKCHSGIQTCERQRCEWKQCKKIFELRRQRRAKKQPMDMSDFCCNLGECKKLRHRKKVEEKAIALHKQ